MVNRCQAALVRNPSGRVAMHLSGRSLAEKRSNPVDIRAFANAGARKFASPLKLNWAAPQETATTLC